MVDAAARARELPRPARRRRRARARAVPPAGARRCAPPWAPTAPGRGDGLDAAVGSRARRRSDAMIGSVRGDGARAHARPARCSSRSAASATACSCPLGAVPALTPGAHRVPVHAPPRARGRDGAVRVPDARRARHVRGADRRDRRRTRSSRSRSSRCTRPARCAAALLDDDLDALTLVPGVGKRTAQRLLVELKARLEVPDLDLADAGGDAAPPRAPRCARRSPGSATRPTRCATSLGQLPDDGAVEDLLRDALQAPGGASAMAVAP